MRRGLWRFLAAATIAAALPPVAYAETDGGFSVTYVEAPPKAPARLAAVLRTEAGDCVAQHICARVEVLREIGWGNRFALYESFAAPAHHQPRQLSSEALIAPPDVRQLAIVWASPAKHLPSQALWVVTHVDAMPDYAAQATAMLKQLGEAEAAEGGHLATIAGRQLDHPNHFTLIEVWANRAAFEAHEAAQPARDFRAKLAPMLGALYDSRLYQTVQR